MSLPEQMALHEVLELEQGVRDALGRNLDLIVVNGRYPGRFSDDEAKQLRAMAEGATRAGLPRAVLAQHRRARVHAARVEWLRGRTPAPIVTLPLMFQSEIGQREYAQFGRELCDPS